VALELVGPSAAGPRVVLALEADGEALHADELVDALPAARLAHDAAAFLEDELRGIEAAILDRAHRRRILVALERGEHFAFRGQLLFPPSRLPRAGVVGMPLAGMR